MHYINTYGMYHVGSINYSESNRVAEEFGMKKFTFKLEKVESEGLVTYQETKSIFCFNSDDATKIISYWNSMGKARNGRDFSYRHTLLEIFPIVA